jgi:hypothetical protein
MDYDSAIEAMAISALMDLMPGKIPICKSAIVEKTFKDPYCPDGIPYTYLAEEATPQQEEESEK